MSTEYRMASLDEKKAAIAKADLMDPGPGTPWEDRGRVGVLAGYFKTAFMGMFQMPKLWKQIRRPDATRDVNGFAIASGVAWGISVLVHSTIQFVHFRTRVQNDPNFSFDLQQFWIYTAIDFAIAVAVTYFVLFKLPVIMYQKLISHDLPHRAPESLYQNVIGYAVAPSLASVIPYVGPPLALFWIAINWMMAGASRLHAKVAASVIAGILTSLAIIAILVIGTFLGMKAADYFGWVSWTELVPVTLSRPR